MASRCDTANAHDPKMNHPLDPTKESTYTLIQVRVPPRTLSRNGGKPDFVCLTATMLSRDGIVVIKFTESRTMPRHLFCLNLQTLVGELDPLFGDEFPFWHMGGDEVSYGCWRNSTAGYIDTYMAANGITKGDYAALQARAFYLSAPF